MERRILCRNVYWIPDNLRECAVATGKIDAPCVSPIYVDLHVYMYAKHSQMYWRDCQGS